MIDINQNNVESIKNQQILRINEFNESQKHLPNEPKLANNKNYVRELQVYKSKKQIYLLSFFDFLHDSCMEMNGINEVLKEAYYELYDDYKAYSKYIKKEKSPNQEEMDQNPEDGSMSPSNPFYTNFESDKTENVKIEKYEEILTNSEEANNFLKVVEDKIKAIKRYLRKDKRQTKVKKMSKNQKKKLKKKLKSLAKSENHQVNETISEVNDEEDPQVIIQDYFKRYIETGEWSWTLWVKGLEKIQQKNPYWFQTFSHFSNEMGIHWNEMFMSDLRAIDQTNVRIDIDSLGISNRSNTNQQPNPDSKEGSSVLFTDDIKPRDTTESNKSELFCESCNQEFRSARYFHIHLRGVRHVQNEINHVSKQKPEIFLEEISKENACVINDISKEDKHVKWLLNNEDISKESATYTCKICDVTCTSQKDFKSHLSGEKHTNNTNAQSIPPIMNSEEKIIENKFQPKSNKKPVARIQMFLNQCTSPLIGLNYVNEYQKRDILSECWYYCELCGHKCDRKSIILHVTSFKHREIYLKYNYYDLYELVEQDPSSKSVREKRLEVYSERVELFEGRKNMNIYLEKNGFSEVLIDNLKPSCSNVDQQEISVMSLLKCQIQDENLNVDYGKPIPIDYSDLNIKIIDKEDGEIESSDDESQCESQSKNICDILSTIPSPKTQTFVELEAGEIENEIVEEIKDADEANENQNSTPEINKVVINKAEFENYDPLYVNDRPSFSIRNTSNGDCRIEFMRHNKDKKKVKLKEVTDDILNHFEQQATWALSRQQQINTVHNKNLHLPPSKNPVGPIYPGVSELAKNSISDSQTKFSASNEITKLTPEAEFTNIVERIESITSTKLSSNRSMINDNSIYNNLLHDVQNMLVNKVSNDRLNEVVRQEFLFSPMEQEYFDLVTSSSHECGRKHILNSPINSKLLNETVETVQNMIDHPSEINNLSELITPDIPKVGDKMSNHCEFLGVNQPPPPHFPKMNSDYYYKVPNYNPMPISVSPYYTTGMIEHRAAFPNFNNNFMYHYPYLTHGNNSKGAIRYFK